jgi:hypothetical protein
MTNAAAILQWLMATYPNADEEFLLRQFLNQVIATDEYVQQLLDEMTDLIRAQQRKRDRVLPSRNRRH